MLRRVVCSLAIAGLAQTSIPSTSLAQDFYHPPTHANFDQVFETETDQDLLRPINFEYPEIAPTSAETICAPDPFSGVPDPCDGCLPIAGACDSIECEDEGWCSTFCSDKSVLDCLKGNEIGPFTYSAGGALRYRYLSERNRLRPPVNGLYSSYNQWRFTPFLELNMGDDFTARVEAIDASTFNEELPPLPIDVNRTDLLQYYVDVKLLDSGVGEKLRVKAGRQTLLYGSQHLVSPLAWANTFRNFEGVKLYYTSDAWNIDGFATRPVNGASGNINRPLSYDTPDQSRTFSGVYSTYKNAPNGVLDFYWLWLDEDDDSPTLIDGDRHTFGSRYAGAIPINDECGDLWMTLGWDYEGAIQTGSDVVGTAPARDVLAGFVSTRTGLTFNTMPWTPTLDGVFFWGSGDSDPDDGTINTVSTLFPLGHAYWGQIDNLDGQNLLDYSVQLTVNPSKKLSCQAQWHWFDKDKREDAIWNVAGAPFGGIVATESRHIGTELDLVATYKVNSNLTLQGGYFWFFYGDAVTENPNPQVADRGNAESYYFFANWQF